MLGPTWPSAAQAIDEKGYQLELPDIWLTNGNPWEIARDDIKYKVSFYGTVDNFKWSPGEQVCTGGTRPASPEEWDPDLSSALAWKAALRRICTGPLPARGTLS